MWIEETIRAWTAAHPDYPWWARALEIASITIFCVFTVTMSRSILAVAQYSVWLVPAAIVGFLAADVASGVVHFWCDHVGSVDTPIVGPVFVKHFLIHHDRSDDIVNHDFIETNGNNFMASAVLLLPAYVLWWWLGSIDNVLLFAGYLSMCCFLAVTNQSHKWAHQQACPTLVRWLQRSGVLLSKEAHGRHHRAPFDRDFCITSGAMNPLLDRLGLFTALARLFRAFGSNRGEAATDLVVLADREEGSRSPPPR